MSIPAPKPLSASTSPSLGPAAARAATQEAQIAQLVQQNRTLEHSLTQLRAQLQTEKARGVDAVNQIKDRWKVESKEWRDGCDSLQAKHRLAHLSTRLALEHERGLRLEDKEALTRAKAAILLREYKITLFQAKETDLVARVATLEDTLEAQEEEQTQILVQHERELARMTARLAKSEARQQERVEELGGFAEERKELETELATLRASSTSSGKQVERLTLQLETLRTQNATIETRNKELQHQVDKWQSLESKGEKEVETLRKRRIELEVRVKQLEENLKETRGMEKKIDKLEASLLEVQEQFEQGQQEIAETHAETDQVQKRALKLEKQVAKLQTALEAEKTRAVEVLEERAKARDLAKSLSGKPKLRSPSVVEEAPDDPEDEEVTELIAKSRSRNQKPASTRSEKSNTKGKGKAASASVQPEAEPRRRRGTGKGKEPARQTEVKDLPEEEEILDEDDMQEVPPLTKKPGRPQSEDSGVEEMPEDAPPKKPRSRAGGSQSKGESKKPRSNAEKAKADEEGDEGEQQETWPKKRAKNKAASTTVGPAAAKPPSMRLSADEDEEAEPQKKKKRKLNVAGGTNIFNGPAGFTWDQDGQGDLGIPSVLSPIKDGQPVPARSGSNSLLSALKLWK